MSAMPAHVVAHLIAVGRIDSDGVSRSAHASRCACGEMTFVGLDHDKCAMTVRVDASPLARAGEVEALLTGRSTYELAHTGRGYRIDPRRAAHIRKRPAGSLRSADVVAEHRCTTDPLTSTATRILTRQERSQDERCPF